MKLFMNFILILSLALFQGCAKKSQGKEGIVRIVTSFYPVYIIARNVAADIPGVTVINMTPPVTGCLHDYIITVDDMKRLENADMLLINGAGMESFIDKVTLKYPKLKISELSSGISYIKENRKVNPHVWVSVSNAITMVKNCEKYFSASDPLNASKYSDNSKKYIMKLEQLKKDMDSSLIRFRGRKIVTFHEAFPYFAREYGLEIAAVVERDPGTEPSAKELAETINIIKKSGIKIIFTEPQYPSSAAKAIAGETGASVYLLDPAVTGPDDQNGYIDIMRRNLDVLKKALNYRGSRDD